MQSLNLATIHTRNRQQIADDAYRMHGTKIDLSLIRSDAFYHLRGELITACSQAHNLKQLNQIKLAIKLGITIIQENVNHAGCATINFKKMATQIYDPEAWALLTKLVAGEYKTDLELICRPRYTVFNCNYKFSLWGTNFTDSARLLIECVEAFSPLSRPYAIVPTQQFSFKPRECQVSQVISEETSVTNTPEADSQQHLRPRLTYQSLLATNPQPYQCQQLGDMFRTKNGKLDWLQPRAGGSGKISLGRERSLKFAATRFCWEDKATRNLVAWVTLEMATTCIALVWLCREPELNSDGGGNGEQYFFYCLQLNDSGKVLQQQVIDWTQAQQLLGNGWGHPQQAAVVLYAHLYDMLQFCQIGISAHHNQDLSFIDKSDDRLAQTTKQALEYLAQLPLTTVMSSMLPAAHDYPKCQLL